jgi:hypothetical protein
MNQFFIRLSLPQILILVFLGNDRRDEITDQIVSVPSVHRDLPRGLIDASLSMFAGDAGDFISTIHEVVLVPVDRRLPAIAALTASFTTAPIPMTSLTMFVRPCSSRCCAIPQTVGDHVLGSGDAAAAAAASRVGLSGDRAMFCCLNRKCRLSRSLALSVDHEDFDLVNGHP